ncbi:MAG: 30S ribosomal protein S9, partial [Paracoccus sp. (in: a-proteobacteria)]|nr:30S ribosomal protein S9 [Paracoccus sp. (in: a-proteobacteria)]
MAEDIKSLDDLKSAVSGKPAEVAAPAPTREPQRDSLGRAYATGKRK